MYRNLNELLINQKFDIAEDVAEIIFKHIQADTQEELNVKSALLKQSFLDQFDIYFEHEYLTATENLQCKFNTNK